MNHPIRPEDPGAIRKVSEEELVNHLREIDRELESYAVERVRLLTPVLDGSAEMGKNLASLSGGALIATISIVQFVAEKIKDPELTFLLPVSWGFFLLTIIASQYLQSAVTQYRSLPLQYVNGRLEAFEQWDAQEEADPEHLRQTALANANQRNAEIKTLFDRSRATVSISFVLAFVALIVFAILNLPF